MGLIIVRSVVFTICEGRVLNIDKKAVADFLGVPAYEEEFSRLGYEDHREVLPFIRRISLGKLINLYKGPSGYGGGCEECILAELAYRITPDTATPPTKTA